MVPLFPAECGVSSVLRYPAAEFRDFVCYQQSASSTLRELLA